MPNTFSYKLQTFLFLSPWLVVFIIFQIYPIFYSLIISFSDFKAISIKPAEFIGFSNYLKLLKSRDFQDAFFNSLKFVLGTVPITMLFAIITAILLNRQLRLNRFYTIAFFAPTATSIFVIATLFTLLYSDDGLFNGVLGFFGIESLRWLKNPDTSLLSIMIMNIWSSFGFYALVFLAALQTIPKEHYEIAKLEGAGAMSQFFNIVLPHLRPTIIIASIINSILAFQVFGEIYIMTQGGPINSTKTLVFFIYNEAFDNQKMGYASAAAYLVFIFLVVLSLLQIFMFKKRSSYGKALKS
ncbi:MAG: sugar ABC transporter permease [SAR324 cluster bacterium]|nr:sugar ABC transporter permease [SAR324 cluster bacterium]